MPVDHNQRNIKKLTGVSGQPLIKSLKNIAPDFLQSIPEWAFVDLNHSSIMRTLSLLLILFSFLFSQAQSNTYELSKPASALKDQVKITLILKNIYTGFHAPTGIAPDSEGNIFVSNWLTGEIIKINSQGQSSVFITGLRNPAGLVFDRHGILYAADYTQNIIYKIDKSGKKSIFADGLNTPTGLIFNHDGFLMVANRNNNELLQLDQNGNRTIIAAGLSLPVGITTDQQGNYYITNYAGGITQIRDKTNAVTNFSHDFIRPGVGIASTTDNKLLAIDNGAGCLRQINPDGSTYILISDIKGAVALAIEGNQLYLGSWDEGTIYHYIIGVSENR